MIKQLIPKRLCLDCQGCCRFNQEDSIWGPAILKEELATLLKNDIPPLAIRSDYKLRLEPSVQQENFVCPFLVLLDNKCNIYSFRPFECQLYPFLINRKDKKIFLAVDPQCPFVKREVKKNGFKEYVQYLTKLLNGPQYKHILKDNPYILQGYPEALNLGELHWVFD
jgi:Fe-S-cluster containining protein